MTPVQARASLRRMIASAGETVVLVRPGTPDVIASVGAKLSGYSGQDLVGDVQQGDRQIIVSAEDVEAAGFPVPIVARSDSVRWNGRDLLIDSVDDASRRVGGVLIGYNLRVVGA